MHGHGSAREERVRYDVSGENLSLVTPACWVSALMTVMMMDTLTAGRPWLEGKSLMGEVGSHTRSGRRRKMLVPALTGQAAE